MWRRNYEPLSQDFRVYALDLLGFGYSDKPPGAPYSADLYVEMLADFLRDVVGGSAHLVAGSLSAAFAVRVADEYPDLVASLVLISPTGVGLTAARPDLPGAAFYGLLHRPCSAPPFKTQTRERGIPTTRRQLSHPASPRRDSSPTITPSATCPARTTPPPPSSPAT